MNRKAIIDKLNQAIISKRKDSGLKDEDAEQYRWMIQILKMKSERNPDLESPEKTRIPPHFIPKSGKKY